MATTAKRVKDQRKPKFSSRQHNRCGLCGRPRAFLRRFGIRRLLPGLKHEGGRQFLIFCARTRRALTRRLRLLGSVLSFRHERYPAYKATREKLTEELQSDFDTGMGLHINFANIGNSQLSSGLMLKADNGLRWQVLTGRFKSAG